jgi:hypothetical protein
VPASARQLSDFGPECLDPSRDSVFGGSWHLARAVPPTPVPDHPAKPDLPTQRIGNTLRWPPGRYEALHCQRIDELGDGGRPMIEQVRGEQVAKLDAFHF